MRDAPQFARVLSCLLLAEAGILGLSAVPLPVAAEQRDRKDKEAPPPEMVLQLAHTGPVEAVAYSPSGTLVASGSADGTIKLWDARTGDVVRTLAGHPRGVRSTEFTADGHLLVTTGGDRTARVWDVSTGELKHSLAYHTEYLNGITVSPDGATASSAGGRMVDGVPRDEVVIWDLASGRSTGTFVVPERIHSLAYTRDGRTLFTGGGRVQNGKPTAFTRGWEVATGKQTSAFRVDGPSIESLRISPGATLVAGGGADGTLWVWDLTGGQLRYRVAAHSRTLNALAFSSDSKVIATAGDDGVLGVWDAFTGKSKRRIKAPELRLLSVAFSPDGRRLVAGSTEDVPASGGTRVWDAGNGSLKWARAGQGVRVDGVALSLDGELLATGGDDGPVRVWNLKEFYVRRLRQPHTPPPQTPVRSLAFSSNGKTLGSTRGDHQVELWDTRSWRLVRRLGDEMSDVRALTFSPDGKVVSCGGRMGSQPLIHWDPATGAVLRRHLGPSQVYAVTYSANGQWVAAGCPREAVVWNARTGESLHEFSHPAAAVSAVAFTPDNQTLATAGGPTVRLWDVASGRPKRVLTGHTDEVAAVAISPDGTTVATGGLDREIRLWDTATGGLQRVLDGHSGAVTRLFYTPDGRLISSGAEGSVRFWRPEVGKLLATFTVLPPSDEGDISTRWLVTTPEGGFIGEDVNRFVRWRVGDKLYPAGKFAGRFRKKSQITQSLAAGSQPAQP